MAADINLLPPEDRGRENKERDKAQKASASSIKYWQPKASVKPTASPQKPFFSRWKKSPKPVEKVEPQKPVWSDQRPKPAAEFKVAERKPEPIKYQPPSELPKAQLGPEPKLKFTSFKEPKAKETKKSDKPKVKTESWWQKRQKRKLAERKNQAEAKQAKLEAKKQQSKDRVQLKKFKIEKKVNKAEDEETKKPAFDFSADKPLKDDKDEIKKVASPVKISASQKVKKPKNPWWPKMKIWWVSLWAKKVTDVKAISNGQQKDVFNLKKETDQDKKVSEIESAKKLPAEKAEDELEVNLIPEDVLMQLSPQKKLVNLLLVIIVVAVATVLVYYSLDWYQNRKADQIETAKSELESVNNKISSFESKKEQALDLQLRFTVANKLIDKHIYWTQFFSKLEEYTLPTVYFTGFAGDVSGKLTLKAVAKDLPAIAEQLAVLERANDFIIDSKIYSVTAQTSSSGEVTGFNFNLELELVEDLFLAK